MVLYEDGSLYDQDREFNVHEDIVVLPYSSGTTGPPKGKVSPRHWVSNYGRKNGQQVAPLWRNTGLIVSNCQQEQICRGGAGAD